MKAHEVRALIADPVAKARARVDDAIRQIVLTESAPTQVEVYVYLSPEHLAQLKAGLYVDGFSVEVSELDDPTRLTVIWHAKARTVRGPLASNTISDTGPSQPNGDRQ